MIKRTRMPRKDGKAGHWEKLGTGGEYELITARDEYCCTVLRGRSGWLVRDDGGRMTLPHPRGTGEHRKQWPTLTEAKQAAESYFDFD